MRNHIYLTLLPGGSFTAPPGVTRVLAKVYGALRHQLGKQDNLYAINANGDLYACGNNVSGQLGTGNVTALSSPAIVSGSLKWRSLANGFSNEAGGAPFGYMAGITQDGGLYVWGANGSNQLALGDTIPRSTPTIIPAISGTTYKWLSCAMGNGTLFAIDTSGALWSSGPNFRGQNGAGFIGGAASTTFQAIFPGGKFTHVASANYSSLAIAQDKTIYSWGDNSAGQVGANIPTTTPGVSIPQAIVGATGKQFKEISGGWETQMALTTDGDIYMWGDNSFGQLGINSVVSKSTATLVSFGAKFSKIACGGGCAAAVSTSGSLFIWGRNTDGQLGQGDVVSRSTPTLVSAVPYFIDVVASPDSVKALTSNGEIYSMGKNYNGILGVGSAIPKSTPTIVVGTTFFNTNQGEQFLAEKTIAVTPGTTYSYAQFGIFPQFNNFAIYYGQPWPYKIVLEYDA